MNTLSHFQKQMLLVKEDLLKMAGLVEAAIHDAAQALAKRDNDLARRVMQGDRQIDLLQNQVEARVVTLLATQQPVASDLRFLFAATKISGHLERVGDHAKKLAKTSLALRDMTPSETPLTLLAMSQLAQEMVRGCLDSMALGDLSLVAKVLARDDDLDALDRRLLGEMLEWMGEDRNRLRRGVELILAGRHLERMGDEATNIAEEVSFFLDGRNIRHQDEEEENTEMSVGPL